MSVLNILKSGMLLRNHLTMTQIFKLQGGVRMKRVSICVGGLLLSFAFVSAVYGGAIDNKTNWSAEYIRTLNRNAATDYADIAAYNPAGTVKLEEGFIINGSIQFLSKKYENNITLGPGTVFGSGI